MNRELIYIPVERKELRRIYGFWAVNKNLSKELEAIAHKYNMVINDVPCMKQVKLLVQFECKRLGARVSLSQISALVKPKRRFPASAIIVLMAVYNLLEEEGANDMVSMQMLRQYVKDKEMGAESMIGFSYGTIIEDMHESRSYIPNHDVQRIFDILISTECEFNEKIRDNMLELCNNNFKGYNFSAQNMIETIKNTPFSVKKGLGKSRKRNLVWNIFQKIRNQIG